jgi:PAS domain S-box-containing protein
MPENLKLPEEYSRKNGGILAIPRKLLPLSAASRADGLPYWRERILFAILLTAAIVSFFIITPSIVIQIREGLWKLSVAITIVFFCAIAILFLPKLKYAVRATVTLLLCYLCGLAIVVNAGVFSGGPVYLFTFAVLAGLLLGIKFAVAAIIINAATLAVLMMLIIQGHFGNDYLQFTTAGRLFMAGASFLLLNSVVAISASVLVQGLQLTAQNEKAAVDDLKKERAQLIETRENLKNEIAGRRQVEKNLEESQEKYRLMAENINDVIWTMNLNLEFTYISPAVERLQGWKAEEIIHTKIDQILTPPSLEKALSTLTRQLNRVEKSGDYDRPVTVELELNKKDGSTVWTEVTASFLIGEDQKPAGILGVARDISDRIKSQKEREALQQKLERSKKMESLGLLAGGVAHDLNNVLSGIVSYPDLLLMDLPEDSPLKKPILTMKESGQKAAVIVQDLLTLARRGVTTTEIVNFNDIISEYLRSPEHGKLLSYHPDNSIETYFEDNLPNIKGSSVHLKKTVMNLVSNAAEAQPSGGPIEIYTKSLYLDRPIKGYDKINAGDYVVVGVKDKGEGIAEGDLQRIFEPFYTKKVMGRSGTGLGMAVVWGTVQDHNGYIDVQSKEGAGTRFEIYFPLTRDSANDTRSSEAIEKYMGRNETILVIDDVKEQREIAANMLNKLNYRAAAVSGGKKALKYMESTAVDLLVIDMIMDPGIDGLETYKRILKLAPGQKAIIASGFAETDRVTEAQRLGVGAFIKKPYTMEKIAQAVRRELDK